MKEKDDTLRKLKFAIYGCGAIARTHAEAILNIENAELFACADLSEASASLFAEKYKIKKYDSLDALCADADIDVINVCTPSGTHADIATRVLAANKNIILEKPMAITGADCDRIIEAADGSHGKLTVISQLRTSPDIRRLKSMIDSGELGRILLCELNMNYYRSDEYYKGSWRGTKLMDGGGALMNQGIHGIDILGYLVGKVTRVGSIVRTVAHDIEVEDLAVANLEFESGALGIVTASTATSPGFDRKLKIYGTRGYAFVTETRIVELSLDGVSIPCEEFVSAGTASTNLVNDISGHKRQISNFIDVICGKECEYIDEREGKIPVELIERIYSSSL